jgi:hypothetical protein
MALRIYIAGKFSSRHRLRQYKQVLKDRGYDVLSTWIDKDGDDASLAPTLELCKAEAERDKYEVFNSNIFILDTFDESSSGGREVELGMAAEQAMSDRKGKYILIVGPVRNVFHATHARFENWEELLNNIEGIGK